MSNEQPSTTPFDKGYAAASKGEAISLTGNPYPFESDEYFDWEDGWWSFFYSEDDDEC